MARDHEEDPVLDWLLEESQPSVRYYTLVDLLGKRADDPEVRDARARMARVGWAKDLLSLQKPAGYWEKREPKGVREWLEFLYFPAYVSTFWRAIVLSDLGLTSAEPKIRRAAERLFDYKLRVGSMVNVFNDEVCIVGNTARTLTRFGYADDRRVQKLYDRLLEDQKEDGGWHCFARPHGTLDGWEGLATWAALPKEKRTAPIKRSIERGAEFYLERELLREGRKYPPWYRLHYPNHYFYDFLVGLDLMTSLGYADDLRLRPALELLEQKRHPDGTWWIDKVHPDIAAGSGFETYDKKPKPFALESPGAPSKWVTLTARRVLQRVEAAS